MAPERESGRGPLVLSPSIQRYAWGDPSYLPRVLGIQETGEPVAEAWFGAHPTAPAEAHLDGAVRALDEVLASDPLGWLGPDVRDRFGSLPYLLKLLAAARPLSIQVHPNPEEAAAGYAREEAQGIPRDAPHRCYRDASDKPELLVALTEFHALCGFRRGPERARLFSDLAPELAALVPGAELGSTDGLGAFLDAWFAVPADDLLAAVDAHLGRLSGDFVEADLDHGDPRRWVLFAHRTLGQAARDRGLAFLYLLDLVTLAPGEALYLDAGVPHAYLDGAGVELMASSDNVLRAGLTGKHVAPEELRRIVRLEATRPPVLRPEPVLGEGEHERGRYRVPADQLALERLLLPAEGRASWVTEGPETLLPLPEGADHSLSVRTKGAEPVDVRRGQACLLPSGVTVTVEAPRDGVTTVFRARVPGALERPAFVGAVRRNVAGMNRLFADGAPPEIIGTVSGSSGARAFWQRVLDRVRPSFGARVARSFHEDLPVNQALGLLLLWQRVRPLREPGDGALIAFVFGEGSRATPLTETEGGQKPAIWSFASTGSGPERRYQSTVELALRTFAPVERHLHRSGFEGMVVKWGDEVQIPTRDLSGVDPRLRGADVVRFVSMQRITDDTARNKDWVGVGEGGRVTAFIPRRPLDEMAALAERGLLERRDDGLYGGINLGSIALSARLLDLLLEELEAEVGDPNADRKKRPDLDPQLFTALCIAQRDDPAERERAWAEAVVESPAMAALAENMPGILGRLRRVLGRYEAAHGRPVRMVAMDFGDQYWGDVGQHRQMRALFMALRSTSGDGEIARALAGLDGVEPDARGNLISPDSVIGPGVRAHGSVFLGARVDEGDIVDSVLVGSEVGRISASEAFDVGSVCRVLALAPGSGSYRVVSSEPVRAEEGERITSVPLEDGVALFRVHEGTDLRDRSATYDVPILGNPLSFREAHERMGRANPDETEAVRAQVAAEVRAGLRDD